MVLAISLAAASCTSSTSDGESGAEPSTTTAPSDDSSGDELGQTPGPPDPRNEEFVAPSAEGLAALAEIGGRLAVVDGGDLAVVSPSGTEIHWLDDDATVNSGQPSWSHDGQTLAWSRVTQEIQEVVLTSIGDNDLGAGAVLGPELLSDLPGLPAFYLQWSLDDSALLYLRASADPSQLELGTMLPGEPGVPLWGSSPMYVAWSPFSSQVAGHFAGTRVVLLAEPTSDEPKAGIALEPSGPF